MREFVVKIVIFSRECIHRTGTFTMDVEIPEIDPNFEPQQRARSNTWPLRPRELTKEDEPGTTQSPKSTEGESTDTPPRVDPIGLNR